MTEPGIVGRLLLWTGAILAALLFHAALFLGVSAVTNGPAHDMRPSSVQTAEIQYVDRAMTQNSELLQQQMSLFDPRPLLLPTEWNAANTSRLGDILQEEEDIFQDFAPMFELEDGNYLDDFGNVPANYEQLSTAQAEFDFPIFGHLGSRSMSVPESTPRQGVEVVLTDLATGRELLRESLYNNVAQRLAREWPTWEPALFLGTVYQSFQSGGFAVLRSSGYDEADALLRELAGDVLPVAAGLQNGPYLVEIAP